MEASCVSLLRIQVHDNRLARFPGGQRRKHRRSPWIRLRRQATIDFTGICRQVGLVRFLRQRVRLQRYIRQIAAIFLVPLLVFLGGGSAHALYRCDKDLVARSSCCCPKHESSKTPAETSISGACCCTVEIIHAAPSGDSRAQVERSDVPQAFSTPVAILPQAAPSIVASLLTRTYVRSARPPTAPTLLSLKTSFLL